MNPAARFRILIVEDEPLVSMMLEDMLEMLEIDVAGVCATLDHAHRAIAERNFDAVLLDLKLGTQRTEEIAAQLASQGMPFAILSGDTGGVKSLGAAVVVAKPYTIEQIEIALGTLRSAGAPDGARR